MLPSATWAQCNWIGVLVQSFLPREVNEETIRGFSELTPQGFAQSTSRLEQEFLTSQTYLDIPEIEPRLRDTLARLYAAGAELYGFKLEPQVRIANDNNLNAFATGRMVALNAGLILYFLNPEQYWRSVGVPAEWIPYFLNYTNWHNDWESINAVLAHEAAHNLMRHSDEGILTTLRGITANHWESLQNERKDLANGQKGGVKRYLWGALNKFLEHLQSTEEQQKSESEADVVALLLLQRAGHDPASAYRAGERIDLFVQLAEDQPGGWQAALDEAFCSDHPAWVQRLEEEERSLNCLRRSGQLCEEHLPFPVDKNVSVLQRYPAEAERYRQETAHYVSMNANDQRPRLDSKIEVEPKDAELYVDGKNTAPGEVTLALGAHSVRVLRQGYQAEEHQVVVFPDIQPKVKIKLKRLLG